jgi:hypothetical protein
MTAPDYAKMHSELASKVRELEEERADLEGKLGDIGKEIESIRRTLAHLSPLAGYSGLFAKDLSDFGITDAVRSVLQRKEKMSAAAVRKKMQERGFDFSKYSAPDATVRTILNRLVEAEKAEMEKEDWKTFYKLPDDGGPEISDDDIPF